MPAAEAKQAPQRQKEYHVKFPLFASNPCLFYPTGLRDAGDARPCFMFKRNNHDIVDLIEICPGMNYLHQSVRHVDDPFFLERPGHRRAIGDPNTQGGAWDYSEGVAYTFLLPGQLPRFPEEIVQRVLDMHYEKKSPSEIAAAVVAKGLNAEVVSRIIAQKA
jgi:hypothetical protein